MGLVQIFYSFLHPVANVPLDVLPNCISKENPKKYDDISAGDFLMKD